MRLSARTMDQIDSPIGVTYDLLDQREGGRELMDLARAAPPYPPAPSVIEHIVAAARDPHGGDYVELTGLPRLREVFAAELSADYRGSVAVEQVLVTAGCNQAFCLTVSALAEPGDEVVLPLPYYFNHDMWLRLEGIRPVYLDPGNGDGADLIPRAARAEALITPRTRAIVLVTPGNPSGVTVPPSEIAAFADVAARHGIALILDETYRSFRDTDEPAHSMFATPGWDETVVSLHSFSKDLAIPGYRVGAVIGGPKLTREVMKLMDCVAICPPRIGQEAAWAGLTSAREWRRERAGELAADRAAFREVMAARPGGFELASVGGFFGWVRHPFEGRSTQDVVRELVVKHDTLLIPGTAFGPQDRGMLRVSVSNVDGAALREFGERLREAGV